MIALPAALPLIRVNPETIALCEPAWLKETLASAATAASMPEWLADDICLGIETYLKHHYPGTVIGMPDLFDRIRKTLNSLGLDQISNHLKDGAPPVRISLTDLARRAGSGFELLFFELLQRQVRAAADGGARRLICYGMRNCVKHLSTSAKWSPRCDRLKDEITTFLQLEHLRLASLQPDVSLAIH